MECVFGLTDPVYGTLLEELITRVPNWERHTETHGFRDNCVGKVDMPAYRAWLQQNYGVTMQSSHIDGNEAVCVPG